MIPFCFFDIWDGEPLSHRFSRYRWLDHQIFNEAKSLGSWTRGQPHVPISRVKWFEMIHPSDLPRNRHSPWKHAGFSGSNQQPGRMISVTHGNLGSLQVAACRNVQYCSIWRLHSGCALGYIPVFVPYSLSQTGSRSFLDFLHQKLPWSVLLVGIWWILMIFVDTASWIHAEEKVPWCSPESCEYISRVAKHVGRFLVAQVAQAALFSQLGKEQDDLKLEVEEPLVHSSCSNE